MNLSDDQLCTLRHMLGINTPYQKTPQPHRNYACVNLGDPKFIELERVGAVEKFEVKETEYEWFRCTKGGKMKAMQSHKKIRKTKAQRRYRIYLNLTDYYPDLTFGEFLKLSEFKELRQNA